MDLDDAFRALGLSFDPAPPLVDARKPLVMAFRADSQEGFLAVAALAAERFEIRAAESEPAAKDGDRGPKSSHARACQRVVDALAELPEPCEFWHVIATRRPADVDGTSVIVGWLALGRGESGVEAAASAEAALRALTTITSAHLDYVTLRPVADGATLLDLVRPAAAPFLRAFRRVASVPILGVRGDDRATRDIPEPPALLRPWPGEPLPWAPLVEAIAMASSHAAFVVRVCTRVRASAQQVLGAERDAFELRKVLRLLEEANVEHVGLVDEQVRKGAESIATARLLLLQRGGMAFDPCVASWEPPDAGLLAVARAALVSVSNTPGVALRTEELSDAALWAPLDSEGRPELIAGATEALSLLRTVEPPSDERSPLRCTRARSLTLRSGPERGTVLGNAELRGGVRIARIEEEARLRHMYVVGQTGTGKSTLLLNMITQDVLDGHGLTVLDPHGALIEEVLPRIPKERADDVVLIDPSDTARAVPMNPLSIRVKDPLRYLALRDRILDELLDTFDALYDLRQTGGPIFEQYFRTFMSMLMGASPPGNYVPQLAMLPLVMNDKDLQAKLAGRIQALDPVTFSTWKGMAAAGGDSSMANMVPYITSKLIRFYGPAVARRILCQPSALDFDQVLAERKIVLCILSPATVGKEAAALLARQIILRLSVAAMERGTDPGQPVHFVYVDEFHNYATERFATMLSELRKFRLGLVLAHQYTSQLVDRHGRRGVLDAVLGNVGTSVAFRMGAFDAGLLKEVMAPQVRAEDISSLPNYSAFVRSSGELGNVPFFLRTAPPSGVIDRKLGAMYRELARYKYARKSELVDVELQETLQEFGKPVKA